MLLCIVTVEAKEWDWGEDRTIKIWSNENAPHSNNLTGEEGEHAKLPGRLTNTTEAELLIYEAKGDDRRDCAVVICPGGGYGFVSMPSEGRALAEWFASQGITAAVLKYRLPNGVKEVPVEDAVEALRIVRRESETLGINPERVGIVGGSAGGHLAALVSTMTTGEDIPAFSLLFYPVISSEKGLAHEGSFDNLLGKDRSKKLSTQYSAHLRVSESTPPALLLHCNDDTVVPPVNSTLYYNALKEYDRHSAIYIFPKGGHGWGCNDNYFRSVWQELTLEWIDMLYDEE